MLLAIGIVFLLAGTGLVVVGILNTGYFRSVNRDIAPAGTPPEERVLRTFVRVSDWEYFDASRIASPLLRWLAEMEHASPMHLSARSTLTAGADRIGPCGSLSRSMVVLLRNAGIPARKAILYDRAGNPAHTVVEVELDGEWRVFDPTYRWYWRRPTDGRIATASDLQNDAHLFSSVRRQHPDYPLAAYDYEDVRHLRWEKLPGLTRVHALLAPVVGKEKLAAIRTPYLYERPTFCVGLPVLAAGAIAVLAAWRLGRRDRPSPASQMETPLGTAVAGRG